MFVPIVFDTGDITFTIPRGGSSDMTFRKIAGAHLCSVAVATDAPSSTFFSSCEEAPPEAVWIPDGIAATMGVATMGSDLEVTISPRVRQHPCNHIPDHFGVDPFASIDFLGEMVLPDGSRKSSWELQGSGVTIEIVVVLKDSGGK